MKKLILSMMAALTLFASCKKENIEIESEQMLPTTEKVEICFNVGYPGTPSTKALTDNWNDRNIKSLYLYVFNSNGALDVSEKVENSSSITIRCTVGKDKTVYALVNYIPDKVISNVDQIWHLTSELTKNTSESVVMTGMKELAEITTNTNVTIPVERTLSKITVENIENNLVDLYLSQQRFIVKKVYLTNVAGNYPLFPSKYPSFNTQWGATIWYNQMKYETSPESDSYICDNINKVVGHRQSYTQHHTFYFYPNVINGTDKDSFVSEWKPRATRLVLEISIADHTYYYPTTLPALAPNHHYKITRVSIEHKGSSSPEEEISHNEATFNVEIVDWKNEKIADVII